MKLPNSNGNFQQINVTSSHFLYRIRNTDVFLVISVSTIPIYTRTTFDSSYGDSLLCSSLLLHHWCMNRNRIYCWNIDSHDVDIFDNQHGNYRWVSFGMRLFIYSLQWFNRFFIVSILKCTFRCTFKINHQHHNEKWWRKNGFAFLSHLNALWIVIDDAFQCI